MNMSMLQYFFAEKVNDQPTKGMFDSLKIAEHKHYMQYQGKHPVIFLSFKDLKAGSFDEMYAQFCRLISKLYTEHRYLINSNSELTQMYEEEKTVFNSILRQEATEASVCASLKDLTQYLYRYYKEKPIVLIDECDAPIQAGYMNKYYDEAINIFRSFLSAGLKDNPYLFKAVLTGILRISRESLFSGLNNLKVYSILHSKYSDKFGFTEAEVFQLLEKAHLEEKKTEIKDRYNGYQIGDDILYNPWSIVNCIEEKGKLKPYWVNTSDDALIKSLLLKSSIPFKENFELLLQGESIERIVNENFVFIDLNHNHESAVWSLLLMTGYLKVVSLTETDQGTWCKLSIPNREIRNLYRGIIERWLANGYGVSQLFDSI